MEEKKLEQSGDNAIQIGEISGGEQHFHIHSESVSIQAHNPTVSNEKLIIKNPGDSLDKSSVLIDGWMLAFILSRIDNNPTGADRYAVECINNFFTALLCWDEIEWIGNSLIEYPPGKMPDKPVIAELNKILKPKDISGYEQDDAIYSAFSKHHYSFTSDPAALHANQERANLYLQWSAYLKTKYFPHPARAEYFRKKRTKIPYTRELLLGVIDKKLDEYYEENNADAGYNIFHCDYPLLYDFIRSQAETIEEQIAVALQLRNDKDVVLLRRSLNEFEKKVNAGSVRTANNARRELAELSQEILNSYKTDVHRTGEFEFDITFISRLLEFGVEERTGLYNDEGRK